MVPGAVVKAIAAIPAAPAVPASANAELLLALMDRGLVSQQAAVDAINDFTRSQMREDGFYRRIMPAVPIEFYAKEEIGGAVGSLSALAKADFA